MSTHVTRLTVSLLLAPAAALVLPAADYHRWPVRVQQLRGEKWVVIYEPFGVQHTVTRSQLRKMVAWDAATQTWKGAAK